MTLDEVKERVRSVRNAAGDSEAAHLMEDNLYFEVLQHIANGGDNAQELAAEAIKAQDIDYVRWYA